MSNKPNEAMDIIDAMLGVGAASYAATSEVGKPVFFAPRAALKKVRAALASQPDAVGEWQPIETHKGHSPVMLGCVASNGLAGMRCSGFLDVTGVWRILYSKGGGRKVPFKPTHWMPLPPPPALKGDV